MAKIRRRQVIVMGLAGAGALVLGWGAWPLPQRLRGAQPLPAGPGQVALNGWVKIGTDDTVTVMMSQVEMGQGVHTGLAMLVAEELDAPLSAIRFEQAGEDPIYNNITVLADQLPFPAKDPGWGARASRHFAGRVIRELPGFAWTGGSSSLKDQWLILRQAGACARALLVAAAAEDWKVPASECRTEEGWVLHAQHRARYGALAGRAARLPWPREVRLKDPAHFRLIGQSPPRLDGPPKQTGEARFAIDALPEGLRYASIRMCPTLGGAVKRFDASAVEKLPGMRKVLALDPVSPGMVGTGKTSGGVVVVADNPWLAQRALDQVRIEWTHGAAAPMSTQSLEAALTRTLDKHRGWSHFNRGNVEESLRGAAKTFSAEYRVPPLAHAAMEPLNCTVQVKDGQATVWASTQVPGQARALIARTLGLPREKVQLIVPYLGGGFGRRACHDFLVQAALVARALPGEPVQLLWTREQDMTHDFYRPPGLARLQAGFDAQGQLLAWVCRCAGPSMGVPSFLQAMHLQGAYDTGYAFPAAQISYASSDSGLPVGIWRSVAHSQNAFFTECFMDEAAAAVKQDPVAFRNALLEDNPRMRRVLARAAELSSWGIAPREGPDGARRARGIALHRAFGSVIAQVAEVSVSPQRQIRVHKVLCVLDCGRPIHPDLIRQQVEGGLIYGLSAALAGQITVKDGQVQQHNFDDYPCLRMSECPEIRTEIIASDAPPEGVGEIGTPAIAPAVANAVFALTGERLRSLPLVLSDKARIE